MTNDVYYPIWRGTDRDVAMGAIGRLTEIGGGTNPDFAYSLTIYAATAADLTTYAGLGGWCTLTIDDADGLAAQLSAAGLPFQRIPFGGDIGLALDDQAGSIIGGLTGGAGSVVWDPDIPFDFATPLAMVTTETASAEWIFRVWPPIPSIGLLQQPKHSGMQLVINGDSAVASKLAPHHTLYVTVGPWLGEDRRAAWLAAQVGLEIIGRAESP